MMRNVGQLAKYALLAGNGSNRRQLLAIASTFQPTTVHQNPGSIVQVQRRNHLVTHLAVPLFIVQQPCMFVVELPAGNHPPERLPVCVSGPIMSSRGCELSRSTVACSV